MITIILALVVLVLSWLLYRDHRGARKVFHNELQLKDMVRRYMDLNHEHMVLTGTLQKAEAVNGKYTLILNVLRSRFPHAWEIVINELFPEQEVEDPCKSGSVKACNQGDGAGAVEVQAPVCAGSMRGQEAKAHELQLGDKSRLKPVERPAEASGTMKAMEEQ